MNNKASHIKNLREMSNTKLLETLLDLKFQQQEMKGRLAKNAWNNSAVGGSTAVDPFVRERRRVIARVLTILNQRGMKVKDSMGREEILNLGNIILKR